MEQPVSASVSDVGQNLEAGSATMAPWAPGLIPSAAACLLAGIIAAGIIHGVAPVFPFLNLPELGIAPKPELVIQHRDATLAFWSTNCAANFAIVGFCMGAAVGCLADRNRRLTSIVLGAVLSSIAGAVVSFALGRYIATQMIQSADQSLVQSTILHSVAWSAVLSPALAAMGFLHRGSTSVPGFAMGGIGLGVLIAVVYNLVFSVTFSQANLLILLPDTLVEKLIWGTVCGTTAGVCLSVGSRPRSAASA